MPTSYRNPRYELNDDDEISILDEWRRNVNTVSGRWADNPNPSLTQLISDYLVFKSQLDSPKKEKKKSGFGKFINRIESDA